MYETYLAHHGIKGQKWGVRRFQNKDGSLTKAGIEKYSRKGYREDAKKAKPGLVNYLTGARNREAIALYGLTTKNQRLERAKKYQKEHLVTDRRIVEANKRRRDAKKQAKKDQKIATKLQKNWHEPYNEAADKFNSTTIKKLNSKYGDPRKTKASWENYTREYAKSWNNTYTKTVVSKYGKVGAKYVKNLPGYITEEGIQELIKNR